jgi:hypothetical protein
LLKTGFSTEYLVKKKDTRAWAEGNKVTSNPYKNCIPQCVPGFGSYNGDRTGNNRNEPEGLPKGSTEALYLGFFTVLNTLACKYLFLVTVCSPRYLNSEGFFLMLRAFQLGWLMELTPLDRTRISPRVEEQETDVGKRRNALK